MVARGEETKGQGQLGLAAERQIKDSWRGTVKAREEVRAKYIGKWMRQRLRSERLRGGGKDRTRGGVGRGGGEEVFVRHVGLYVAHNR